MPPQLRIYEPSKEEEQEESALSRLSRYAAIPTTAVAVGAGVPIGTAVYQGGIASQGTPISEDVLKKLHHLAKPSTSVYRTRNWGGNYLQTGFRPKGKPILQENLAKSFGKGVYLPALRPDEGIAKLMKDRGNLFHRMNLTPAAREWSAGHEYGHVRSLDDRPISTVLSQHPLMYNPARAKAFHSLGALALPLIPSRKWSRRAAIGASLASAPMVLSELLASHRGGKLLYKAKGGGVGNYLKAYKGVPTYAMLAASPLLAYKVADLLGRWKKEEKPKAKEKDQDQEHRKAAMDKEARAGVGQYISKDKLQFVRNLVAKQMKQARKYGRPGRAVAQTVKNNPDMLAAYGAGMLVPAPGGATGSALAYLAGKKGINALEPHTGVSLGGLAYGGRQLMQKQSNVGMGLGMGGMSPWDHGDFGSGAFPAMGGFRWGMSPAAGARAAAVNPNPAANPQGPQITKADVGGIQAAMSKLSSCDLGARSKEASFTVDSVGGGGTTAYGQPDPSKLGRVSNVAPTSAPVKTRAKVLPANKFTQTMTALAKPLPRKPVPREAGQSDPVSGTPTRKIGHDTMSTTSKTLLETVGRFAKTAAQDNDKPQRSATGESEGLSFKENDDDYMTGQKAWEATSKYFKGGSKVEKEPNPFKGEHRGEEKDGLDKCAEGGGILGTIGNAVSTGVSNFGNMMGNAARAGGMQIPQKPQAMGGFGMNRNRFMSQQTHNNLVAANQRKAGQQVPYGDFRDIPAAMKQQFQANRQAGRTNMSRDEAYQYWLQNYANKQAMDKHAGLMDFIRNIPGMIGYGAGGAGKAVGDMTQGVGGVMGGFSRGMDSVGVGAQGVGDFVNDASSTMANASRNVMRAGQNVGNVANQGVDAGNAIGRFGNDMSAYSTGPLGFIGRGAGGAINMFGNMLGGFSRGIGSLGRGISNVGGWGNRAAGGLNVAGSAAHGFGSGMRGTAGSIGNAASTVGRAGQTVSNFGSDMMAYSRPTPSTPVRGGAMFRPFGGSSSVAAGSQPRAQSINAFGRSLPSSVVHRAAANFSGNKSAPMNVSGPGLVGRGFQPKQASDREKQAGIGIGTMVGGLAGAANAPEGNLIQNTAHGAARGFGADVGAGLGGLAGFGAGGAGLAALGPDFAQKHPYLAALIMGGSTLGGVGLGGLGGWMGAGKLLGKSPARRDREGSLKRRIAVEQTGDMDRELLAKTGADKPHRLETRTAEMDYSDVRPKMPSSLDMTGMLATPVLTGAGGRYVGSKASKLLNLGKAGTSRTKLIATLLGAATGGLGLRGMFRGGMRYGGGFGISRPPWVTHTTNFGDKQGADLGLNPYQTAFFTRCAQAGIEPDGWKAKVDQAHEKFGADYTGELYEGLEKIAANPWGLWNKARNAWGAGRTLLQGQKAQQALNLGKKVVGGKGGMASAAAGGAAGYISAPEDASFLNTATRTLGGAALGRGMHAGGRAGWNRLPQGVREGVKQFGRGMAGRGTSGYGGAVGSWASGAKGAAPGAYRWGSRARNVGRPMLYGTAGAMTGSDIAPEGYEGLGALGGFGAGAMYATPWGRRLLNSSALGRGAKQGMQRAVIGNWAGTAADQLLGTENMAGWGARAGLVSPLANRFAPGLMKGKGAQRVGDFARGASLVGARGAKKPLSTAAKLGIGAGVGSIAAPALGLPNASQAIDNVVMSKAQKMLDSPEGQQMIQGQADSFLKKSGLPGGIAQAKDLLAQGQSGMDMLSKLGNIPDMILGPMFSMFGEGGQRMLAGMNPMMKWMMLLGGGGALLGGALGGGKGGMMGGLGGLAVPMMMGMMGGFGGQGGGMGGAPTSATQAYDASGNPVANPGVPPARRPTQPGARNELEVQMQAQGR